MFKIDALFIFSAPAVKIQSFRGLDIISPNILSSEYGWNSKNTNIGTNTLTYCFTLRGSSTIIDRAKKLNLDFITTPVSSEIYP